MGKILDVWRKFKGFGPEFEDFYFLGAYHPILVGISIGKKNNELRHI